MSSSIPDRDREADLRKMISAMQGSSSGFRASDRIGPARCPAATSYAAGSTYRNAVLTPGRSGRAAPASTLLQVSRLALPSLVVELEAAAAG
ncbi:MAG TPA: hypothetical protein VI076_06775 [Actinopolymorphaceae bacterium]